MTFDDSHDSSALALWEERLTSYLGAQEASKRAPLTHQPNAPWPEADNPMVGYLIARAMEIHDDGGLLVVPLLSDDALHVTGAVFSVDGGRTAG